MKTFILFLLFISTVQSQVTVQEQFVLEPGQSMLMTGKGPGQDGTINPFKGKDCLAVVKNTGSVKFTVRIQNNGELIKEFEVKESQTIRFKLPKDHELYLDSNPNKRAKAEISYEKLKAY